MRKEEKIFLHREKAKNLLFCPVLFFFSKRIPLWNTLISEVTFGNQFSPKGVFLKLARFIQFFFEGESIKRKGFLI